MKISPHFAREEFEVDGSMIPIEAIPAFTGLCKEVLEPLRAEFNEPFYITSGYRSEFVNSRIGGSATSQHVATECHCAADGYFVRYRADMRPVFDWLRNSKLPFDQLILEHGKYGDIVHLSYTRMPRRQALEGATFNASGYKAWPVEG